MSQLHIFNPGYEVAAMLDDENYTPPANVCVMMKDLALLPLWYADKEDWIYTGEEDHDFVEKLPEMMEPFPRLLNNNKKPDTLLLAKPWGLSPHIIKVYKTLEEELGVALSIPAWNEKVKMLTGRKGGALCLDYLKDSLPEVSVDLPVWVDSLDDIEFLLQKKGPPLVVKTPYSSSGRGVLWLRSDAIADTERKRIAGAMRKQSTVSIENGLDKALDFAMEFYSDGRGGVKYEGLSLFDTDVKGNYTGNILASQFVLEEKLFELVDREYLGRIQDATCKALKNIYSDTYEGFLGVDMLVYKENDKHLIHPCVEVNMRNTMGMIALRFYKRYVCSDAEGGFYISFEKEKGKVWTKHCELSKEKPLKMENGKIRKGYFSLCPVTPETHYLAYIMIL
jgi:hypothetical protein